MKRLLFSVTARDFDVQTFCTGGKGGQNQNRRKMGVRIVHRASGAVGEGREYREQPLNKRAAFLRLLETPEWKGWHRAQVARVLGLEAAAEDAAERGMTPHNLRVEYRTKDGWLVECDACDGTGWVEGGSAIKTECAKCGGSGAVDRE